LIGKRTITKNPTIKSIFGFRQIPSGCDDVKSRLINQMNEWDNENCPQTSEQCPAMPCGQKCLYKVGIYFVKLGFSKRINAGFLLYGNKYYPWKYNKLKPTNNKCSAFKEPMNQISN
jgi:hypothetical protein